MSSANVRNDDPSERAYDLRDASILASARAGLSADGIAKSWGISSRRVRQLVSADLARELGMIPSDSVQDARD